MYVVIVETQIGAEERVGEPAFLARLEVGAGGCIERDFGLEVVNHENRRALAMLALPGQVFVAQRWWRTDETDIGGEVWFTVDEDGEVTPLDTAEALDFLRSGGDLSHIDPAAAPRTPPTNVFCRPASLSGKQILRGNL